MVLDGIFNFIFWFAIKLGEPWDIIIIALILTFLITLAYKYLTDQEAMKSLKSKLKDIQKEIKENKDQPDKIMGLQKTLMETNLKYMKHSLKPMLFTFLPIIIIFNWIRTLHPQTQILINLPIKLPLIGSGLGWLGTYIISSIIFSMIIRKVFKIH